MGIIMPNEAKWDDVYNKLYGRLTFRKTMINYKLPESFPNASKANAKRVYLNTYEFCDFSNYKGANVDNISGTFDWIAKFGGVRKTQRQFKWLQLINHSSLVETDLDGVDLSNN